MAEENDQQQTAAQEPQTTQQSKAWYVIHTQTGYEDKVAENLLRKAQVQGFEDRLFLVWVPVQYLKGKKSKSSSSSSEQKSTKKHAADKTHRHPWWRKPLSPAEYQQWLKDGELDETEEEQQLGKDSIARKYFPSYVLVQMVLTSETYWFIKNTTGATGFLGDLNPVSVTEEKIADIFDKTSLTNGQPKYLVEFKRGDSVLITEGPFKHFIGTVEEVNEQKHKLNVIVTVFDRATPVEVDFLQVEKN